MNSKFKILSSSEVPVFVAKLPNSSKTRSQVVNILNIPHHRPKTWKKFKKMLEDLPWVEYVRFDKNAFGAPRDGVKAANRGTKDGRHIFWIRLYQSEDTKMAVSIETTLQVIATNTLNKQQKNFGKG